MSPLVRDVCLCVCEPIKYNCISDARARSLREHDTHYIIAVVVVRRLNH